MISFISIAHAVESTAGQAVAYDLVGKINKAILFPLIALMMAIAFVVFIYGAFQYVKNSDNETARETGKSHLMYGVIGMLVMLSAMAILQIAAGTFGLDDELQRAKEGGSISSFAPTTAVSPPRRAPVGGGAATADDYRSILDGSGGGVEVEEAVPTPVADEDVSGVSLIIAEYIASGWDSETAISVGLNFSNYTAINKDSAYDSLTIDVEAGRISASTRDQYMLEQFGSN